MQKYSSIDMLCERPRRWRQCRGSKCKEYTSVGQSGLQDQSIVIQEMTATVLVFVTLRSMEGKGYASDAKRRAIEATSIGEIDS